jgi:hypothetical protein
VPERKGGAAGVPRSVRPERGAAWYAEAIALFRRSPLGWASLGAFTLLAQWALQAIPEVGALLDKVLMPLVGSGLLVAAGAAARGERPRLRDVLSVFAARPHAQLAIVASGLIAFAAEAAVVHALADVNVLAIDDQAREAITPAVLFSAFAAGIAASLPLSFVPLLVLFGGRSFAAAFGESFVAFQRNAVAMVAYGAIGFVLLVAGVVTLGIGLVVVFPLLSLASWAAWQDVFQ